MKGCRRRRPWSKHVYSVCWDERRIVSDADSSVMGFIASCRDIVSEGDGRLYTDRTHNVDIAKLVQPEVVRSAGCIHEVAVSELLVDLFRGEVELVQDPLLYKALVPSRLHGL